MAHKVIQWSTGNVGMHALRHIIGHPGLELAGLWVHSADKVGRDAGDLCGLDPVGVLATDDVEALLASDADCVCYTATADIRMGEAVEDIARILAAGKDVVSSSLVNLVYPPTAEAWIAERLEAACQEGGTSCFTNGIDPGWANELIPMMLTGVAQRVDRVLVQEILNYSTYDQPTVLFDTMGFGQPLDAEPLLLLPGSLTLAWGGVVHMIAAALGVEVTEIRESHERRPAPETFTIPPGTVEEGTTAALRFAVAGVVGGEERIVVEHVTRLRDDLAEDWPRHPFKGGNVVTIDGVPSMKVAMQLDGPDGDENTAGLITTATRVLNAIPAVIAAEPGLLSPLDLPLITGTGLMPT